jgi:putative copper export protein
MPILLAGTIEIVHIEQVSALFTFRLGQVLLYYKSVTVAYPYCLDLDR